MSYDLMLKKGMDLQNAGALNQAEDIYLKILQTMPENSDVWNLLGLVAQSKGNLERARDCFLTAIKYAPKPFFAHFFNLGLVYKSLNKPKESIEAMGHAVRLKNDFKEGWLLLGVLQAENEDSVNAIKSFCKALDCDENYEDARAYLCFYTKDLNNLFKLSDENKNNFTVQYLSGCACENIKDKEKYLRQAIEIAPERTEAMFMLGDVLKEENNLNEALIFYHKVLNIDEKDVHAILGIADIYLAQKEFQKAEFYYQKSFALTRDIANVHINYGSLLYQQGRLVEALEEYKTAVALVPDRAEVCYNLALILKDVGDFEEALGLMFHAHLCDKENEMYAISIMETLEELYRSCAELALKIAQNWQKQEPENLFSKRILSALGGIEQEENDVIFAEKLFNNFADKYDETLARLEPQIITKFKEIQGEVKGVILDLGCGTGMAANELKTSENIFDGVDISKEMLKIAENKGVYRKLYEEDILSFLELHSIKEYQLIVAFDVFCYLGNLGKILKKLKGKDVWFSLEKADEERREDYYLAPTNRYKHQKRYIERILKEVGFKKKDFYELVLRQEHGENVEGYLVHIC